MPNYDVVIKDTKVGDPTVVIKFAITNSSLSNLRVQLTLRNNDTNRSELIMDETLDSVRMNQEIILMNPFSYTNDIPSRGVAATVTFNAADGDHFTLVAGEGIDDNYASNGNNSFTDSSIAIVTNDELPSFNLPGKNDSKIVAVQCIDESGNYQFLHLKNDVEMKNEFNSLDENQIFTLKNEPNGFYSLRNDKGYIKLKGSTQLTIRNSTHNPKSFYIYVSDGSNSNYYMKGITTSGKVGTQHGKEVSTNSNNYNKALKWYFH